MNPSTHHELMIEADAMANSLNSTAIEHPDKPALRTRLLHAAELIDRLHRALAQATPAQMDPALATIAAGVAAGNPQLTAYEIAMHARELYNQLKPQ